MLRLGTHRIRWRVGGADLHFAVAAGIAVLAGFGLVRANGLLVLLLLTLLRHRRIAPPAILLAGAIALILALKAGGNWYAGHVVVRFVAVVAAAGVALSAIPPGLVAWFSRWSLRTVAVYGVAWPAFAFLSCTNGSFSSGDTLPVVPTAVQMLRHGDRDLADWNDGRWDPYRFGPEPYFLRECPGRPGLFSAYPAGMELFALPAAVGMVASGIECTSRQCMTAERITARLVTAATLALFYLLAVHFVRTRTAYVATVLLTTGSTFTSTTGLSLWQQGGVAFWIVVALLCEAKGRWKWLQAFACAAMLACRPSSVTFLVPFGLWIATQDWRRACGLTMRAVICYLPWAAMYLSHYGTPFGPSMGFLKEPWQFANSLTDVLFSPGRGLLVYQCWILLACFALRPRHPWSLFLISAIALQSLLIASWPMWWGGHCYGSRLLAETIPLAGLLILQPLERLLGCPAGRWLVGGLIVLGLALHLPGAFGDAAAWNAIPTPIDSDPARLRDWRHPPFLFDWHR